MDRDERVGKQPDVEGLKWCPAGSVQVRGSAWKAEGTRTAGHGGRSGLGDGLEEMHRNGG